MDRILFQRNTELLLKLVQFFENFPVLNEQSAMPQPFKENQR